MSEYVNYKGKLKLIHKKEMKHMVIFVKELH